MRTHSLEERNREVLAAIVRTYIATGQPVGSHTISHRRRDRLSPATIRNTMADLEAEGYLQQPHTSAGRVPTDKAYRFYVEHLARPGRHLHRSEEDRIRREIHGTMEGPQAILERASHVLSLVTHNIGIVVSATAADTVLQHIEFVRLADRRVLVVLAPRGAPVRSRVVRVDEETQQDELDRIANCLNRNFTGWRLEAARNEITRLLQEERARYDELLRRLASLWRQGILESEVSAGVYLEGASHLMGRPELDNPQLLRDLLRALEEKGTPDPTHYRLHPGSGVLGVETGPGFHWARHRSPDERFCVDRRALHHGWRIGGPGGGSGTAAHALRASHLRRLGGGAAGRRGNGAPVATRSWTRRPSWKRTK